MQLDPMNPSNELIEKSLVPTQIPIIDFHPFMTGDTEAKAEIANQISHAIQSVGCVCLKNAISQLLIDRAFTQAEVFFALPLTEKQQIASDLTGRSRGYIPFEAISIGTQPPLLHEAFSFGRELTADLLGNSHYAQMLDVPNKWPQNPPEFSQVIQQLFTACQDSALSVLEAFAMALNLPNAYFTNLHAEQNYAGTFNYYPKLSQPPKTGQTRFFEHTDLGSITLLFQDRGGGLEVCTPKGEWIVSHFVPNTVLLMTADMMSRWTNDVLCATPHRVSVSDDFQAVKERYSFSFFVIPDYDLEVTCLEQFQQDETPKYSSVVVGDYLLSATKDRAKKYGKS
jgi:isopenicillin N synthase-like dioxygenase